MANRVQVLPEQVANQIAAGEVIERPASVVKELVENSLDAGATRIEVEIQNGGRNLIRVTDDGCGMGHDDALLCLERHATSKISKAEDLFTIRSLGFRGEAIPSIAAVSRFRLLTCEKDAERGTEILIDGGKVLNVHEAGSPAGTTIEVRSIFNNVPARRKFLRTEQTEWAHIEHFLRLVAIARPDIHLEVFHNGTNVLRLPRDKTLNQRLAAIFEKEWITNTVPVDAQGGGFTLTGVTGKPGTGRGDRQEMIFFVNGRNIQNATLNQGLLEGYQNSLMKGRYPVAVLFFEMPPGGLDVNVHPSKREVRFHDPLSIRRFIASSIAIAIRSEHSSPVELPTSLPAPIAPPPRQTGLFHQAPPPQQIRPHLPESKETVNNQPAEAPRGHGLRVIGSLLDIYLLAEGESGLVLIDQKASRERVLFEQFLRRMKKEEMLTQALLLPVRVEVQPLEANLVHKSLPLLQRAGIGVSELGRNAFMIDALPPHIETSDVEGFFHLVIQDLFREGEQGGRKKPLGDEEVAAAIAREAVRLRDVLKPGEIERLLDDLHQCDLPYTCPSGRPTMIMISRAELERKFGKL